jgi:hypothetical protein
MFFLLTAGILAVGYFSYRNYEKDFRAETEHQLFSIGDLEVDQLAVGRNERLANGRTLLDILLSEKLLADLPELIAQQNSGILLHCVNEKYYREVGYTKG